MPKAAAKEKAPAKEKAAKKEKAPAKEKKEKKAKDPNAPKKPMVSRMLLHCQHDCGAMCSQTAGIMSLQPHSACLFWLLLLPSAPDAAH
jgi:hypothetical protein